MAAYTRLSKQDIEEILERYDLGRLVSVEPLSLGISNSNYQCKLKNDSKEVFFVILKVSNDKDKTQLQEEQSILAVLKSFPLSLTPFETSDAGPVYEWKGLNGAVFPFAPGSKPMGSADEIFQLGQALAQMHLFSQEKGLEASSIRNRSQVGYDLEKILAYCAQKSALSEFRGACKDLLEPAQVDLWRNSDLPGGLIHGDLYLDNTLFLDGKLNFLLDFEQAGLGAFIHDIGISISGSCLDKDGVSEKKIQAFLNGYQKSRRLIESELKLLNFAILLGFLDISLWRIKRFHDGNLDPRKKDSYKELLDLAAAFKHRLNN